MYLVPFYLIYLSTWVFNTFSTLLQIAKTRLIGLHRKQRKHYSLLKITLKGF